MEKTNDEVKAGLECCQLAFGFRECGSRCPYYEDSCCGTLLAADAIALIQQLEATVSEKEKVVAELSGKIGQLQAKQKQLLEKIELLKATSEE